jgi:hypothetical protein
LREEIPGSISDYFDGDAYKKAKIVFNHLRFLQLLYLLRCFVTLKVSKQGLTIVHIMVIGNWLQSFYKVNEISCYLIFLVIKLGRFFHFWNRYTAECLFQKAIDVGNVQDLDSYLLSVVSQVESLDKHDVIVEKFNIELIKAKSTHILISV